MYPYQDLTTIKLKKSCKLYAHVPTQLPSNLAREVISNNINSPNVMSYMTHQQLCSNKRMGTCQPLVVDIDTGLQISRSYSMYMTYDELLSAWTVNWIIKIIDMNCFYL
jgi:hypothetical protein